MAESLKIETIIEESIIKKRAVKNAPWRHNADGTYNNKPSDPEYFKKYWREHFKKEYICIHCDKKLLNTEKIKRHEMSHLCIKARNKKLESEN
jgi:hypothetical protein